jgi:hypothetical protein
MARKLPSMMFRTVLTGSPVATSFLRVAQRCPFPAALFVPVQPVNEKPFFADVDFAAHGYLSRMSWLFLEIVLRYCSISIWISFADSVGLEPFCMLSASDMLKWLHNCARIDDLALISQIIPSIPFLFPH